MEARRRRTDGGWKSGLMETAEVWAKKEWADGG
jgi:hypothetical protein